MDELVKLQKAGPAYQKKIKDVKKYLGDIIREDTKVSYPRLTDMYTEMQICIITEGAMRRFVFVVCILILGMAKGNVF